MKLIKGKVCGDCEALRVAAIALKADLISRADIVPSSDGEVSKVVNVSSGVWLQFKQALDQLNETN